MSDELTRGLARQLERLAEAQSTGAVLGGWKVGLTSGSARDAMGKGFRPFGYLLEDHIFESPAVLPLSGKPGISVENELCFTFAHPLRGAPGRQAVIDALASVAPAFEVVEERLAPRSGATERLADNLSQWGVVVGAPRRLDWTSFDFRGLRVTLSGDGEVVEEVEATGHIDDHFDSISALVRQLHRFDLGLEPGSRVITGSYTRQGAHHHRRWRADFGQEIGTVELTLT